MLTRSGNRSVNTKISLNSKTKPRFSTFVSSVKWSKLLLVSQVTYMDKCLIAYASCFRMQVLHVCCHSKISEASLYYCECYNVTERQYNGLPSRRHDNMMKLTQCAYFP